MAIVKAGGVMMLTAILYVAFCAVVDRGVPVREGVALLSGMDEK